MLLCTVLTLVQAQADVNSTDDGSTRSVKLPVQVLVLYRSELHPTLAPANTQVSAGLAPLTSSLVPSLVPLGHNAG
jgi:hypothetical protein